MTTSDTIAIVLLIIAIMDTVAAKYILPNMLKNSPQMDKEQQRKIIGIVNIGTFLFAGAAIIIYVTQIFG